MPRPRKRYIVGGFAFIPHPAAPGLWLRTDTCVLKVPCSACGSVVGEPCQGKKGESLGLPGYHSSTHWVRRKAGKRKQLPMDTAEVTITVRR